MGKKSRSHYESLFAEMDDGALYGNYGAYGGMSMPKDFVFDPKNPPLFGCTPYHPPLNLTINGKEREVYGSSCIKPNIDDADIYVSLDRMAKSFDWEHPWSNSERKHIRMFIPDGGVPPNEEQFNRCIDYVVEALDNGKKVHIGCIAGHGRTGIFLAAIAQKTMGEQLKENGISAIDYVRNNYCDNVVETLKQVLFLQTVCDVETPLREKREVEDFKFMFNKEMGMDLNEMVKTSDFSSTQNAIQVIERKLTALFYPPKGKSLTPFGKSNIATTQAISQTTNLPIEANGTIAMGTDPKELENRLLPSKTDWAAIVGLPKSEVDSNQEADKNIEQEFNGVTNRTFKQRLDPVKLAKLQQFKLRKR